MSGRLPLAALAAGLVLATGCTNPSAPAAGALLNEPTAIAVFRGVTVVSAGDPSGPYPYRPFFAVANAGSNDLTILDGVTDQLVPAPVPLRGLVYPVPGRPVLLAAADLGDRKPDLLVAVTAGDLPGLGGSRLEVISTWRPDGAVAGTVDVGGDVLALAPLPFDPADLGTVKVVAALAGDRIAVVTFSRSAAGDGTRIDVAGARVVTSAPLGFQPLDLAVVPGDRSRVFAATTDTIPVGGGVRGVAQIDVTGTPFLAAALDALAPTRLVGAARLTEALPLSTALDASAFAGQPTVDRVYAVLDESACGLAAPIACGLVALDPAAVPDAVRGSLLPDPTPLGTLHAPFLAPIPVGRPLALGTMGPPAQPPSALEPQFAGTYLKLAAGSGTRQSTAAAGVATPDAYLTYVDLARWDVPSQQSVHAAVKASVISARPFGTAGTQYLALRRGGIFAGHLDPNGLSTAVGVTAGFTPTDRWTVTREGVLPGLSARRGEARNDGSPWLALQSTATDGSVEAAVHLWDPTLGVTVGDTVVLEPSGLGTCTTFEATVAELVPPDPTRPGGYVRLAHRVLSPGTPAPTAATLAEWNHCVDAIPSGPPAPAAPWFRATFRAGGYVLVRGTGAAAVHVGRPALGELFTLVWEDEAPLAAACALPPSRPWPGGACDEACRAACERLQRARLARRVGYVVEPPADLVGPALAFTLDLEQPASPVPRDLALILDTSDGRAPLRAGPSAGVPLDPRAVVPFDRSPWVPLSGVRFLVPYAGGIVLDGAPSLGGSEYTIQ